MYKFEETIEKLCLEHTIAGMAVAVTDREKVIFAKGFGVDSVERPYIPADPISMYRIASVTQMFADPASGYGGITLMNTKHTELRLPIPQIVLTQLRNS